MCNQSSSVKISIVTVCFNSEKTIEQTIKSVINQSYKNIEYIIIDGGSTDGTLEIIRKYEPYITYWVSEPDKGIYDAMNKGIRVATGDIIGFINSDDWYENDVLFKYAEKYKLEKSDVLYGDLAITNEDGVVQKIMRYDSVDFSKIYTMLIPHPTTFIKASVIKNKPFSMANMVVSDYEMITELVIEGYRFQYVGRGIVSYFRQGGISTTNRWLGYKEHFRSLRKMLRKYNIELDGKKKRCIYSKRLFCLFEHIIERKKQKLISIVENVLCTKRIKKIVVFGAGHVGKWLVEILGFVNVDVVIVDNDTQKYGKNFSNYKISSPAVLSDMREGTVLIANYKYSSDIVAQIDSMDLGDGIHVFSFEIWSAYLINMTIFSHA